MNKRDLAIRLAAKANLARNEAYEAVNAFIEVITESLSQSEPVRLTGFGKFEARARKATTRINPRSRKMYSVPAKTVCAFKPGKNLKEIVARHGEPHVALYKRPPERDDPRRRKKRRRT